MERPQKPVAGLRVGRRVRRSPPTASARQSGMRLPGTKSRPRTTLASLPPELYSEILEWLVPSAGQLVAATPFVARHHLADLRRAALTMRAWRGPAGKLLHRVVVLDSHRCLKGWLADPRWKDGTHSLILDGLSTEMAEEAIEHLKGAKLRFLAVRSPASLGMQSDVLLNPALRGIRHLIIDTPLVDSDLEIPPILFPHLKHLSLYTARFSKEFIASLLHKEVQLVSFDWSLLPARRTDDETSILVANALLPHCHRLTSLGLPSWVDPETKTLEWCHSLRWLSVADLGQDVATLPDLSRELEVLIVRDEAVDVDVVWHIIHQQPNLKVVNLFAWHSPTYSWDLEWERKEAIAGLCEILGIRLTVWRDQHEIAEILSQGTRDDRHRYTASLVLLILLISFLAGRVP